MASPTIGASAAALRWGCPPCICLLRLKIYNHQVGLMLCCPITTQIKGYPFEVAVKAVDKPGVVLANQIKSLDWKVRHAEKAGVAPVAVVKDVIAKAKALLAI